MSPVRRPTLRSVVLCRCFGAMHQRSRGTPLDLCPMPQQQAHTSCLPRIRFFFSLAWHSGCFLKWVGYSRRHPAPLVPVCS